MNPNINYPKGFDWLFKSQLPLFEPNSSLNPWYFLRKENYACIKNNLYVFARRQDCDDIFCFEVMNNEIFKYHIVEFRSTESFDMVQSFDTFWDCFRAMIEDIESIIEDSDYF